MQTKPCIKNVAYVSRIAYKEQAFYAAKIAKKKRTASASRARIPMRVSKQVANVESIAT